MTYGNFYSCEINFRKLFVSRYYSRKASTSLFIHFVVFYGDQRKYEYTFCTLLIYPCHRILACLRLSFSLALKNNNVRRNVKINNVLCSSISYTPESKDFNQISTRFCVFLSSTHVCGILKDVLSN